MLSRAEARDLILSHTPKGAVIKKDLSSALFHTLAHDLHSKRCQPPFDRIMMDGIAINYSDFERGQTNFPIQAFQAAGSPALHLTPKNCIEVATGAPLPLGCDTVIPYEDIEIEEKKAHLKKTIKKNQFIHTKSSDYPQGQLLLKENTLLGSSEIALAASNGLASVEVLKIPRIAIISTGDELVEPGKDIRDHEIYRSNIFGIDALLKSHHFSDNELFHLNDNKEDMLRSVRQILNQFDVLIFSGGVSKGKKDFLPEVLKELGVREVFHRVNQKPGKPMWFGVHGSQQIFGLPGNPVSTQVTLRDYVLESLWKRLHQSDVTFKVQLSTDLQVQGLMTHYIPVQIEVRQNQLWARPVIINTSGDFSSLSYTSGFIILDNSEGKNLFSAESFQSYRFWAKVF